MRSFKVTFFPLSLSEPVAMWPLASFPAIWELGFTTATPNVWPKDPHVSNARQLKIIIARMRPLYRLGPEAVRPSCLLCNYAFGMHHGKSALLYRPVVGAGSEAGRI